MLTIMIGDCVASASIRARFCVRFQAVQVQVLGRLSLGNPTEKASAPTHFKGESLCPSVRFGVVLLRFRCLVKGPCHVKHSLDRTRTPSYCLCVSL